MMMFLFFSYNHLHIYCSKIRYNYVPLSGKQPQVYRAVLVSSHAHTLNTTYKYTHNNKRL